MITSRKAFIALAVAFVLLLGAFAYALWQNFWWQRSVDYVANEAGTAQAMSAFRHGRLVL
jgi:hypothetical protein